MLNVSRSTSYNTRIMNWKVDGDNDGDSSSMSELPAIMVVWERVLQHLHRSERICFLAMFIVVTSLAVVGNVLTLYVVVVRLVEVLCLH